MCAASVFNIWTHEKTFSSEPFLIKSKRFNINWHTYMLDFEHQQKSRIILYALELNVRNFGSSETGDPGKPVTRRWHSHEEMYQIPCKMSVYFFLGDFFCGLMCIPMSSIKVANA